MEKRIYVNDGSTKETQEFVERELGSLNEILRNNPQFIETLSEELQFLVAKSDMNNLVPGMKLYIDDNGKGFTIKGEARKDPNCWEKDLQDNLNYRAVRFTVDEYGNMEIIRLNGTLYHFDDYMRQQGALANSPFKERVTELRMNSRIVPTVINVYHQHKCFLPNGIQVEESSYSDACPLSAGFNEITLKDQTGIHSPARWNYNTMPSPVAWEFTPYVNKYYRLNYSLGLVEAASRYGREEDCKRSSSVYHAGTEYADKMGVYPTPVITYKDGRAIANKEFEGKTRAEIEEEVMMSYYKAIKCSKTKELRPDVYEALLAMVKKSLAERYQIDPEELNSDIKK